MEFRFNFHSSTPSLFDEKEESSFQGRILSFKVRLFPFLVNKFTMSKEHIKTFSLRIFIYSIESLNQITWSHPLNCHVYQPLEAFFIQTLSIQSFWFDLIPFILCIQTLSFLVSNLTLKSWILRIQGMIPSLLRGRKEVVRTPFIEVQHFLVHFKDHPVSQVNSKRTSKTHFYSFFKRPDNLFSFLSFFLLPLPVFVYFPLLHRGVQFDERYPSNTYSP